ncbi:hypothetical protein GUITHDRAFT_86562 [Guillardia theta CCMP2712]|uniref:Guanylate cyclase domain-containing protein n=1 Tax=Guillardia theta (strain CCMP2712) TaxID=905079 RepID=L1JFN9_GUITC|nr:hypothetical protein GUITHDRAFT_86562 [Guillardia theta CCMP2712]EKX46915.1 hypothetical protein GUITHDRAFT_86562 [Guillardia theta CCMP2712]|eukprot:XP_005833895.1 hypothetical protein GUITHDRAFT_86562 [Guillardia theta CCMP2712]
MLLSLISLVRSQVVAPVMSSIEKLNEIAKDPLTPLRDETKKSKFLELVKIESALIKFGMLLQVAFGEAGSDIIRECITKDGLNYNKPGKVVQAFYGFCDIRRFTDLTEIMQADVVKLVNKIAHRVHSAALENFGAPNKNIGDAFLLIWKPKGQVAISTVADSALRTYIRIILENYSDPYLRQVAKSEAVQQRVPGYSNWLGFGLHYGWSVESSIGSKHKIDISYLSPHVNLAARLESATKQYKTEILLSEDVVRLLSPNVRKLCRLIDRVTTITLSQEDSITDFYQKFPPRLPHRHLQDFDVAVSSYLGGEDGKFADWRLARELLKKCLKGGERDGPAEAILNYIRKHCDDSGCAPASWTGYRELEEK